MCFRRRCDRLIFAAIRGALPENTRCNKDMISGKILRDAIISGANNINNQRVPRGRAERFPCARWRHRHQHGHDRGRCPCASWKLWTTAAPWARPPRPLLPPCCAAHAATPALSPACCSAASPRRWKARRKPTAADLVEALKKGVEGAYKAVMKPTEGTILTVARVACRGRPPPAAPRMCPPCGTW